jgi:hypothetical protein
MAICGLCMCLTRHETNNVLHADQWVKCARHVTGFHCPGIIWMLAETTLQASVGRLTVIKRIYRVFWATAWHSSSSLNKTLCEAIPRILFVFLKWLLLVITTFSCGSCWKRGGANGRMSTSNRRDSAGFETCLGALGVGGLTKGTDSFLQKQSN